MKRLLALTVAMLAVGAFAKTGDVTVQTPYAELVYPFGSQQCEDFASFAVRSGVTYRLDYAWREVSVTKRSYLIPRLKVLDADGKVLLQRNVGLIQHRVFDPVDRSIQRWQVYAVAAELGNSYRPSIFQGISSLLLPEGAAKLELSISRHGEKAAIDDVRMTATPAEPPARHFCKFPPLPEVPECSDAELDAALAARVRSVPSLKAEGGRTELTVDGRRLVPKIYKNCRWDRPHRYRATKIFGEKGFNIFTLGFSLSDCWRADGSVALAPLRVQLRKMLKCNPDALIFLEVGLRPRANWGAENPDEVFRCESGKYALFAKGRVCEFTDTPRDDPARNAFAIPSYFSEKYATEASAVLDKAFREIESWPESKGVIGVYISFATDGQWMDVFDNSALPRKEAADYSVVSQRAFDAYRTSRGEQPVPVPATSEFRRRDRVDFGEHADSVVGQWRDCYVTAATKFRLKFAHAVKEATDGRLLVGSYSPNTGLAGAPHFSNMGVRHLLKSKDFDFFAVVPWYVREHVDPVLSAVYDGSLAANGKLFVSELDLRSGDVGHWGYWGSDLWKTNHTAATFRTKVLHYVAHALTRGGSYHAYDMDGGWFNTPESQATWKIANAIADRTRPMPASSDRIAVVAGERFMFHRSLGYGHMFAYAMKEMPRYALAVAGIPHAVYLVDDLLAKSPADAELPKVILFTDVSTITCDEYRELRRRYAKPGRVLVWCGRPGVYAPDGAKIDAALGMCELSDRPAGWIVADGTSDDPLMRGVKGFFSAWYPYYADGVVFPPLWAPKGWKPLASPVGTRLPGVSVRREQGLTEVHLSNPGQLHDGFLRNLVREAGFEPLLETGDISGFGSGLFYILAQRDGEKRFRLPAGCTAGETLYGPACRKTATGYAVTLKRDEIFILAVNPEGMP